MPGFLSTRRLIVISGLLLSCLSALTACGDSDSSFNPKSEKPYEGESRDKNRLGAGLGGEKQETGSLFGPGGLFGSKNEKKDDNGTGVAVNAYLWRASLDTINFIPLISADPFGGVIITDWYTPAETPNERMKVQITILDRELRADGVRVSVFKQQSNPKGGGWLDAQVDPHTNTDIENAILTRARQLRIAQGG